MTEKDLDGLIEAMRILQAQNRQILEVLARQAETLAEHTKILEKLTGIAEDEQSAGAR